MYTVNISSDVNGVNMPDKTGNGRRPAYHHGDLRRALVDAAMAEAGRGSLANLSLRWLAASAGVSPAAVYRHFPDVEALLAAAAHEAFDRFAAYLQAGARTGGDDPAKRLKAMGWAYLRFAETEPGLYSLMFGRTYSPSHTGLMEAAAHAFRQLTEGLSHLLPEGQMADAEKIAGSLWALVHGLADLRARGLLCANGSTLQGAFDEQAEYALTLVVESMVSGRSRQEISQ